MNQLTWVKDVQTAITRAVELAIQTNTVYCVVWYGGTKEYNHTPIDDPRVRDFRVTHIIAVTGDVYKRSSELWRDINR